MLKNQSEQEFWTWWLIKTQNLDTSPYVSLGFNLSNPREYIKNLEDALDFKTGMSRATAESLREIKDDKDVLVAALNNALRMLNEIDNHDYSETTRLMFADSARTIIGAALNHLDERIPF